MAAGEKLRLCGHRSRPHCGLLASQTQIPPFVVPIEHAPPLFVRIWEDKISLKISPAPFNIEKGAGEIKILNYYRSVGKKI